MRPTDFCHPNEWRAPVRRTFSILADRFRDPGCPATVCGCHVAWSRQRAFSRCPKRFGLIFLRPLERVVLVPSSSRIPVTSVGLFDPRRSLGWDLWRLCREPFFLFALTSPSCVLSNFCCRSLWFRTRRQSRKSDESAKTTLATVPWRPMTADDPRRLPSTGTLRRIRWPLQPRSRDYRTAFGDVATAGWRSHVTLGLFPISSRCGPTAIRDAIRLFVRRARRRVTADARPDLGPRSLDPDRTFWCAFAECIWGQTSPDDFCNCYDVRALGRVLSQSSLGRAPWRSSFSYLPRPLPCGSGDRRRAAHRPLVSTPVPVLPGCPGLPDRDTDSNAPPSRIAPTKLQWR